MRLFNRLIAALLAAAVAGAGGLAAAEVLVARTSWPHDPPLVVPYDDWLHDLRPHHWTETTVQLGCAAAIVLGLLLIVAAAMGHERRVAMVTDQPEVQASTSPASVARALRKDASRVDGVGTAHARLRRRRAKVAATVRLGDPAAVERELQSTLTERLTALSLAQPPKLGVSVKRRRSR